MPSSNAAASCSALRRELAPGRGRSVRGRAARLATMIRIDHLWLAVEPLDTRAGAERLLARRGANVRLGPGPSRLPVRQRTRHPHQAARARRFWCVVCGAALERRALRVAAPGACRESTDGVDAAKGTSSAIYLRRRRPARGQAWVISLTTMKASTMPWGLPSAIDSASPMRAANTSRAFLIACIFLIVSLACLIAFSRSA